MTHKNKYIYILLYAISIYLPVCAQIPQMDNYLLSPSMSGLGEYGEIPVSLHTGIPAISIPVYTAKVGSHEIPISLSYHGGGVMPDRHPGWVGMGWTLQAGGSIMRIVHGRPDESDHYNYGYNKDIVNYHHPNFGWFFDEGNGSDYNTKPNDNPPLILEYDTENNLDLWQMKAGMDDREADEYIFNFLGFSGKFYYTADKGWVVNSNQFMKIIFDVNNEDNYERIFPDNVYTPWTKEYILNRSKAITHFKLYDTYGNEYIFGGMDNKNAIEYSVGFFTQDVEEIAATAWHLSRINYADGRTVSFSYDKKEFIAEMGIAEEYCTYVCPAHYSHGKMQTYNGTEMKSAQRFGSDYISGSLISPSYLKSIDLGVQGTIEFEITETDELKYPLLRACQEHYIPSTSYDRSKLIYIQQYQADGTRNIRNLGSYDCLELLKWYKLTDIKVKSSSNRLLHSYKLSYNDDIPSRAGQERLALLSLEEINGGGRYSFEYDNMDKLPEYCSYNVDHWGFYKESGITKIITDTTGNLIRDYTKRIIPLNDLDRYTRARMPNPNTAIYGSLIKINYPTGGYTRFEFEPNYYSSKVSRDRTTVESLEYDYVAGGIRIKKIFNYDGVSNNGAERLVKEYKYFDASTGKTQYSSGILLNDAIYHYTTKENSSTMFLSDTESYTAQPNHGVGINSDGCHIGYTFVSEIYPDGSMRVNRFTAYSDPGCNDIEMSALTSGITLYRPFTSYSYKRGNLLWTKDFDSSGEKVSEKEYTYKTINDVAVQSTKQIFNLSPESFRFDRYTYNVLTHSLIPETITERTYDKGTMLNESEINYTYDKLYNILKQQTISNNGSPRALSDYTYTFDRYNSSSVAKNMVDQFMLNKVLSEKQYRYDYDGGKYLVSTIDVEYTQNNLISPTTIKKTIADKGIRTTDKFEYGKYYNPIYQLSKDGNEKTVYVWGYEHSCIVAVVVNATVKEVQQIIGNLDTFGDNPTPDFNALNSLSAKLPNAAVTIYKHIPGIGISECVNPDGTLLKYDYDALGRLIKIKDGKGNLLKFYQYNIAGEKLNYNL